MPCIYTNFDRRLSIVCPLDEFDQLVKNADAKLGPTWSHIKQLLRLGEYYEGLKHSSDEECVGLLRMQVKLYMYMYVCMYVCMYIRAYVCMYICIYVYMYVCMHAK